MLSTSPGREATTRPRGARRASGPGVSALLALAALALPGCGTGPTPADTDAAPAPEPSRQPRSASGAEAPEAAAGPANPADAPEGMVWIAGGTLSMGSPDATFADALPVHDVELDGFWMDETEVTNAEFARFVEDTGYVTLAERVPRPEDYPGAPPENLVAGSVVFTPPSQAVPLDNHFRWWSYVPGADWRHPQGPESSIDDRMDHPVVHVAWEDVEAYAAWADKRVPTEAEWEWAARGGLVGTRYVWGDDFQPGGEFLANSFQGSFPHHNTAADGYVTTNPVRAFEANGYGLRGMAGNVWEWTSDWYRPDTYERRAGAGPVRNPTGPGRAESFDPSEPGVAKKVHRGGSFLCTDQYCTRYRPDGRGKGVPDTGTDHLGFRLVRDP